MQLPILGKLKDGEKFDFATLVENLSEVEAYWDWWWEQCDFSKIDRPETLCPKEEILYWTANKSTVDFVSYGYLFNDILLKYLDSEVLPRDHAMSRPRFQEDAIKIIGANSCDLENPQITFAAGGYGSGKTTVLGMLSSCGGLKVQKQHMVGVDYFKFLIPEFSLIQSVFDGRASLTVQAECKDLSDRLFRRLIADRKSFIWDSSLSDWDGSNQKINLAKQAGYATEMIAILTPESMAIQQAMERAQDSRRFPNPQMLPKSHRDFRKYFFKYVPLFDCVRVFAKIRQEDYPVEVAVKENRSKELAIIDQMIFNGALV